MNENILTAIYNIVQNNCIQVREESPVYNIRINNVGEKLEIFIKDAIADTFNTTAEKANKKYSEVYSWLGAQNNPPDLIIRNGDAFEIKKIESIGGGNLALNSSHPKDRLYSDDSKITNACRVCEDTPWKEKDIYYTIGVVPKKSAVKKLFFVHGLCYVANREVYEKIHSVIKDKTDEGLLMSGYTSDKTKELGRVNKIDPLGITNLRIRGMWEIKNPFAVFDKFLKAPKDSEFTLYALMTKEKYNSYPKESRDLIEKEVRIKIDKIELIDPNNLAKRIQSILITTYW